MANNTNELYVNMINAIAAYLGSMEELIELDSETPKEEKLDLVQLDGRYILDRLEAETDAMDEVAKHVKLLVEGHRKEVVYTIQINESQRKILLDAMQLYPKVCEAEDAMVVDLRNLPDERKFLPGDAVIAFCN